MIIFNIIRLSIRNFKNMKLRSLLTVLGIGIGIAAILFLVSLGQGLQKLLIERITTAESLLTIDVASSSGSLVSLTKETIQRFEQIEAVSDVSPVKSAKAKIRFEGVTAGITAHFVRDNFFRLAGLEKTLEAKSGKQSQSKQKNITSAVFLDNQSIIVSRAVLQLLSIKEEPIGKLIDLKANSPDGEIIIDTTFKIIDVLDDELSSFVYLPSDVYPTDKLSAYDSLKVQVKSTTLLESVRSEIIKQGFTVSALSDTVQQANRVFKVMQIILAIFGVIALIVAAIGMFNTMTIALLERTNEIGIMRSIGASRRDIWLMFLIEALIIGFLGGLAGVSIGIGLAETANFGLNFLAAKLGGQTLDIFYYPLWFIIAIIIFSTLVSFVTGFYPARRAAHLNPLDALRYK